MLSLLSFRGIVNWLGFFDVVVMREGGSVGKKAGRGGAYDSSPFYFWPYEGSVLATGEKE